jgi:hypothetical protein
VADVGQAITGTTSVEGKFYPEKILSWKGSEAALRALYNNVWNIFHPVGRKLHEFSSQACLSKGRAEIFVKIRFPVSVASEVRSILSKLDELAPQKAEDLAVGHGVEFQAHSNSLTEVTEEALQQKLPNNRICIHRRPRGNQEDHRYRVFVISYKAPHKLSVGGLRRALDMPGLCQKRHFGRCGQRVNNRCEGHNTDLRLHEQSWR